MIGEIMKIKTITYPTALEKIPDVSNDNIDVFVETENGLHFMITICTPLFYLNYMEKEKLNFISASPPDIIVKRLTHDIIKQALESFCEDDGYWMKLYFLSGSTEGVFSKKGLDKMLQKSTNNGIDCLINSDDVFRGE